MRGEHCVVSKSKRGLPLPVHHGRVSRRGYLVTPTLTACLWQLRQDRIESDVIRSDRFLPRMMAK